MQRAAFERSWNGKGTKRRREHKSIITSDPWISMEKYRDLTVKEYEKALPLLSDEQLLFLKTLYGCPLHTASAKEIAEKMGRSNYQFANSKVAAIGKEFSQSSGVDHPNYKEDVCPSGTYTKSAYFMFIGPYFKGEKGKKRSSKDGWEMKDELCEALRNLRYVD